MEKAFECVNECLRMNKVGVENEKKRQGDRSSKEKLSIK